MTTQVPSTMISGGPAFSAYLSTASTGLTSTVFTKVGCQVEEFDTAGAYDNATNFRFQPTTAGYYQLNGVAVVGGTVTFAAATIYKNGVEFKRGMGTTTSGPQGSAVSALVYLNGSTDYVELYIYATGTSLVLTGNNVAYTYFQGYLART